MPEHIDSVSSARPRRGLPRRPGENGAVTDGVAAQPASTPAEDAPALGAVSTSRRAGLPRPNAAAVGEPASPTTVAPLNDERSKTGRRSGLPRPGTFDPAPDSGPSVHTSAPATDSPRSGLSNDSHESAPVAPPADTSGPPPTGGRRAGLATKAAPASTLPTPTAGPVIASEPTPTPVKPQEAAKTKPLWMKIAVGVVGLFILAGVLVLLARWLRTLDPIQDFLAIYPGESHLPENAPVGLPAWMGWQHFLNAFFIVLIIRTGWQVRTQQRPPATWIRNNEGLLKTKNPPKKISLTLWAHLALDTLWFLNGIVFVIVLFATGQWMRVVPTSWDVIPNAMSALLQYVSLSWPVENGWVNYNSLQLLAYFTTIFIAAPLAAITGVRMSGAWPVKAEKLNKVYPMELARAIHFPVMLYFTLFVIMHVFLVFSTGVLRNLNHMYASQDATSWTGFWIFFASLAVMAGAIFAARPLILAPIAQLMGRVGR